MLKKLLNKKLNNKQYLICFFFIFLLHLITINWYPTNFEGAFSKLAYFFSSNNKLFLIDSFYNVQANTIIFSLLGSLLSKFIIFINPEIALRIISAFSYFFLIYAFRNLLIFLKKEDTLFLIIVFFSNPLIWYYGHRIYVDLFAFSIGVYSFSILLRKILNKKNLLLSSLLLGMAILLKPFNLIFIPISFIYLIYKFKFKLKLSLILYIIFPILLFLIFINLNKYYLNFFVTPQKFISSGNIFIQLENISIKYILNIFSNFIYYVGYLGFITFPLLFKFEKKIFNISLFIKAIILFPISFLLSKTLSYYGEINLGPLQKLFNIDFYKFLICLSFIYILYLIFSLKKIIKNNFDLKKIYFLIFIIIFYLFILSFLKLSQRYLLLALPFLYCLIFTVNNSKYIYLINLKLNVIVIGLLLLNYNIKSNLSSQLLARMQQEDILFQTQPGPYTAHLMHEYQHIDNYKKRSSMYFEKKNKYEISKIKPIKGSYETFSYYLFNKSLEKIYLIKVD